MITFGKRAIIHRGKILQSILLNYCSVNGTTRRLVKEQLTGQEYFEGKVCLQLGHPGIRFPKNSRLNIFVSKNSCYLPIGSTFDPVYIIMKKKTPVRQSRGRIGLSQKTKELKCNLIHKINTNKQKSKIVRIPTVFQGCAQYLLQQCLNNKQIIILFKHQMYLARFC